MKSETDDGLSSCSKFPERPSSYELESGRPVLPEIEDLRGKVGEQEIEFEEGAVHHREGARRMTPHKSEACRAEIEI